MSKISVKDRVLFITGANRRKGIGRALVEEAINRGAKKVYATARDMLGLEDLVEKYLGKVIPVKLDITNSKQIQRASQEASDVDILVNNAGLGGTSGCLNNYNEEVARLQMEVNYFGSLHLIRAFSKNLIKNNGAIANVISIGGLMPSPWHITYSASKAALYSLTQALRIEMQMNGHSVPVFGIYPGPIDTDMAEDLEVTKERPSFVAKRVFDGMTNGILDITTDALSDKFQKMLEKDPSVLRALQGEFDEVG